MLLARLLTKYDNGREQHQTWQISHYDYYQPEDEARGWYTLYMYESEGSVNVDCRQPPEDADGIPYQRLFIMNSQGETIDQFLVSPHGGWEKYIEEREKANS